MVENTFLRKKRVQVADNIPLSELSDAESFARKMFLNMGWDGKESSETDVPKVRPKNLGIGASEIDGTKFEEKESLFGKVYFITKGTFEGMKCKLLDNLRMGKKEFKEAKRVVRVELEVNGRQLTLSSDTLAETYEKQKAVSGGFVENNEFWLATGLVVKIKSRSKMNGKYYATKAEVLDCFTEDVFTLLTFDGKVQVNEFKQRDLQTVIPKGKETVMIVRGEFKGETGSIVERTKNKMLVQLEKELVIEEFGLDDICQVK